MTQTQATRTLALFLPLLAPAIARADHDDRIRPPANLAAELQAPQGEELAFHALGVGVQIYDCKESGGGYAWVFRSPEATLFSGDGDRDDRVIGLHYAGPTWANDRGSVVGTVLVRVPSPVPAANIPWLRLVGSSQTGKGRFAKVTTIQRLNTVGGVAPAVGCDANAVGAVARVDYQADYFFYQPAGDDDGHDDDDDCDDHRHGRGHDHR